MATTAINPSLRRHSRGCSSHIFHSLIRIAIFMHAISLCRHVKAFAYNLSHHHRKLLLSRRRHQNVMLQSSIIHSPTRTILKEAAGYRPCATASAGSSDYTLELCIPTPEDMEDIGGLLSVNSKSGDVILLDGDLGAGKTCFSRGFIRGRTGAHDERVTSPTYLLSNTYSADDDDGGRRTNIYHMDLYRLSGRDGDLAPLDLNNAFANGICLVEWPSRLSEKPSTRLDITLTIDSTIHSEDEDDDTDSKSRCMKLEPHGDQWVERLKFLESEGYFEDLIMDSY